MVTQDSDNKIYKSFDKAGTGWSNYCDASILLPIKSDGRTRYFFKSRHPSSYIISWSSLCHAGCGAPPQDRPFQVPRQKKKKKKGGHFGFGFSWFSFTCTRLHKLLAVPEHRRRKAATRQGLRCVYLCASSQCVLQCLCVEGEAGELNDL